jgi:hypothetical protein
MNLWSSLLVPLGLTRSSLPSLTLSAAFIRVPVSRGGIVDYTRAEICSEQRGARSNELEQSVIACHRLIGANSH